jgi:hypothetical protein
MPLQRARFNPCLAEFLRSARSRRETFHPVSLSLGSFADGT